MDVRYFHFGTALWEIDGDGEKLDEATDVELDNLRDTLARIDGYVEVEFYRYSMKIGFIPRVIGVEVLDTRIIGAFTDLMAPGSSYEALFPFREKTVEFRERALGIVASNSSVPPAPPAPKDAVEEPFATAQRRYQFDNPIYGTNDLGEMPKEWVVRIVGGLRKALRGHRGVHNAKISRHGIVITYYTRLATADVIDHHLDSVLGRFSGMATRSTYLFPFDLPSGAEYTIL